MKTGREHIAAPLPCNHPIDPVAISAGQLALTRALPTSICPAKALPRPLPLSRRIHILCSEIDAFAQLVMYASIQIPKPTDEQVLERAPIELFRCILNDPNVRTYGTRGQGQQGVDLYGKRDGDPERYVGIQCKLKSGEAVLTKKLIKEEVEKALTFKPSLTEYFIITTAPDNARLEEYARELEVDIKNRLNRLLSIQVWGWNTMQREIHQHPTALKAFWPDYTPYSEQIKDEVIKIGAGQSAMVDLMVQRFDQLTVIVAEVAKPFSLDSDRRDPLEAHIDAEIDTYRATLMGGHPTDALALLGSLLERLSEGVSGRLLFRVKANMAACHLALGNEEAGNTLVFEACAHAPEEPKAKVNLVLAHLRTGNWQTACKMGRAALNAEPGNADLAGAYVHALAYNETVSDPLSNIPEELRDSKPVRVAQLIFLRHRGSDTWTAEARVLRRDYPDERFVVQAAAEAVLDTLLHGGGFSKNRRIPTENLEDARAAHADLLRLWKEVSSGDRWLSPEDLALFANLILACDMLGEIDTARSLVAEADAAVLSDEDINVRIAQLAFNAGEEALFRPAFERLPEGPARFSFAFYDALQRQDWQRIGVLTADSSDLALPDEREIVDTAKALAPLLESGASPTVEAILAAGPADSNDVRSLILVYDALERSGFQTEAERVFAQAIDQALRGDSFAARAMLGYRAAKTGGWRLIPDLLSAYVDPARDTSELRLLATAFVNVSPPSKGAARFYEGLAPAVRDHPYYVEREAVFHYNRGALAQAEQRYRIAIDKSSTDPLDLYLPLISILLRRGKADEVAQLAKKLAGINVNGSGEEKALLAHFLMDQGHTTESMRLAYRALTDHPESAEVHSAFCKLILMNTRAEGDTRLIPATPDVQVDCWIRLRNAHGDVRCITVSDSPTKEPSHILGIVVDAATHQLARACLGQTVGTDIEQEAGLGLAPVTWRIEEIKHKYTLACQTILGEFDVRFPDSDDMAHMNVEEGNVQPILDYIKRQAEYHEDRVSYYTRNGFPIRVVAALQRTSSIDFAHYLQRLGHRIQTCRGTDVERQDAWEIIKTCRANGAVVDAYTAWVLASIGALDVARAVFGRLFIAQSCLDEIAVIRVKMEQQDAESFSIGWYNGQFVRSERSEEQLRQQISLMDGIQTAVTELCEPLPREAPEQLGKMCEELIQSFAPDMLDPIFCASDGRVLLSEDLYLRQLAKQEHQFKGAWIQIVLLFACGEGYLTIDKYCDILLKLNNYAHDHLTVNSDILARVAERDQSRQATDFRQLANLIGTEQADIDSHMSVAIGAVCHFWTTQEAARATTLTSILLENLIRYRTDDWNYVLALLCMSIPRSGRQHILDWVQGHFLPFDRFTSALREVVARLSARRAATESDISRASLYGSAQLERFMRSDYPMST